MASDSVTSSTTTPPANGSDVNIYGTTGTEAKSGTMSTTTAETTGSIPNNYEARSAGRNHVGVDDHSYLSSYESASTEGEETVDGQGQALERENHYNELFADSKYGSTKKMKYS